MVLMVDRDEADNSSSGHSQTEDHSMVIDPFPFQTVATHGHSVVVSIKIECMCFHKPVSPIVAIATW